ncbi:hypothetical protein QZH41_008000 [Actinostola sp. cb2023]|nr:hypothetical protein QZH41_008000 [Actinostola sp. cb2023]
MIPGLSKWRIDQARQHAIETGKGQPVASQQVFRQRIDELQIDHFLDFISRPEFLQDVPFGTKTLKLDSGEKIHIPAIIRTLIPSRIIAQYTRLCAQQQFEPAGERSLFRILEVCSASLQKSLQGLDSVTADGTEAFDNMVAIVDTLAENGAGNDWRKNVEVGLRDGKRYLKTDFKSHVGRDEKCSDHCVTYALSDNTTASYQIDCEHTHDTVCEQCINLDKVFEDMSQKMEEVITDQEQKDRITYEYTESVGAIYAWKAHLLRLLNQEEAKQDILFSLDDQECLIIMDWAMKFLPQRYRERMSDFFGKRGKSWHVSSVITKSDVKYKVECFVHLFESCIQNSFAVASIIENLLTTIKEENPTINKAYFRSDNAGCYHNGPLLLSLPFIGQRSGIVPQRYDFSDPQAGKDICDRRTASMKAHIRRWINEKHDVITAQHMKQALESHGGLKGCRVAVVKIDPSTDNSSDNKIPGISLLNNFSYEYDGIRAWRSYNIGPGRLFTYADLQVQPQRKTCLGVIHGFGARTQHGTMRADSSTTNAEIFSCNEIGCVLTFRSEAEAVAHMDTGKHVRQVEKESLYDSVRKKWADIVTGVQPRNQLPSSGGEQSISDTQAERQPRGWALKATKKPSRMSDKVKAYLVECFDAGVQSGLKANPIEVAKELKLAKDQNGKTLFTPQEWRTSQQIASFFSRLSAAQRQRQIEEYADENEIQEEDIRAWEAAAAFKELQSGVVNDFNQPDHPIMVAQKNICQLVHSKKLSLLKIAELMDICTNLQIQVDGQKGRKISYIKPLESLLKAHVLALARTKTISAYPTPFN